MGFTDLVKKPTKWMTNCKPLADLLSLVKLEGGNLTKKAASYPISLVRDILKVVVKVKQLAKTANYPKDPAHVTIPESLGIRWLYAGPLTGRPV